MNYIIATLACAQKEYSEELLSLNCINYNIYRKHDLFLIVHSDYCTDCFQKIVNTLKESQKISHTCIIVSGKNYKDINSFVNNFPDLNYIDVINANVGSSIYPLLYFKSNDLVYKEEIETETDLIKIITQSK